MTRERYKEIVESLHQDFLRAEIALIDGRGALPEDRAAEVVEKYASRREKCIIQARRAADPAYRKNKKQGWAVRAQMNYIVLAEREKLKCEALSESQLKRSWKKLVERVAAIAARMKITPEE